MAASPLKAAKKAPTEARQKAGAEDLTVDRRQDTNRVPLDENGEPMIEIFVQAREHVGLENFSNATIGPNGATMWVRKGQEEILTDSEKKALASCLNQLAELVEVDVVAEQRGIFLNAIDPAA